MKQEVNPIKCVIPRDVPDPFTPHGPKSDAQLHEPFAGPGTDQPNLLMHVLKEAPWTVIMIRSGGCSGLELLIEGPAFRVNL